MWSFSDEGGFQWSILCVAWVMFWEQKGIKRRILEHLRETIKEKTIIYKVFLKEFSFFWIIFIFHSFLSIHEYEQDSFYPSVFRLCLSLVFCGKEKNGSCISLKFFISMTLRQSSKPIFPYNSPIIVYDWFMLLDLIICDF